jgi:hypothetical protein
MEFAGPDFASPRRRMTLDAGVSGLLAHCT